MSGPAILDIARTPDEVEFLLFYREAEEADKRRLRKLLRAAAADLLPDLATIKAFGPNGARDFADALPEVE